MNVEKALIEQICRGGCFKEAIAAGVVPEFFEAERTVFAFISSFISEFEREPGIETLKSKLGYTPLSPPVVEPLEFLVQELKAQFQHRLMADKVRAIAEKLKVHDLDEARALFSTLESELKGRIEGALPTAGAEAYSEDRVADRLASYDAAKARGSISGVPTPWATIDDATLGWNPEDLVLVCARPKTGKSWFLLMLAKKAWEEGKKVVFITFEMSEKALGRRMDALVSEVCYKHLRAGKLDFVEEAKYHKAMDRVRGKDGLKIVQGRWASTPAALSLLIQSEKPDLLIVDGVYMMSDGKTGKSEMWERMANLADELKKIAQRESLPIIISTQLNRGTNVKKAKAGTENIGLSDRFGAVADIVIALFAHEEPTKKELAVKFLANREDMAVNMRVRWDFERMGFEELPPEESVASSPDSAEF